MSENERRITHIKPEFEVTIGSAYFCFIESKTNDTITYENEVFEVPTIKTLGVTREVSSLPVWASGDIYKYLNQTAGADIALVAVTLPQDMLAKIEGSTKQGGHTFNRTNDIEREFAFGYWGENYDRSFTYVWHPVCKLIPTEENHATRTQDLTDPQRNYSVKVLPFNNVWRHKYSTKQAIEAGEQPLTKEEFFLLPIYTENQLIYLGNTPEPPIESENI